MPGSPKKRARREAEAGREALPSPHVRRVPDAKWRAMTPMERFRTNLGMSEDDAHTLLSIPWERADLHEKALKIRVFEVYMKHAVRIEIERHHSEERTNILEQMRRELSPNGKGVDHDGR